MRGVRTGAFLLATHLLVACASPSAKPQGSAQFAHQQSDPPAEAGWYRVHVVSFHAQPTVGPSPENFPGSATAPGWTMWAPGLKSFFDAVEAKRSHWARLRSADARVQLQDLQTGKRLWVLSDLRAVSVRKVSVRGAEAKTFFGARLGPRTARAVKAVACAARLVRRDVFTYSKGIDIFGKDGRITPDGSLRATCKDPLAGTKFRNRGELVKAAVHCGGHRYRLGRCARK